jgi:hypothetical protein
MFSADRTANSEFLTNLYSLINNVRYQRQPFCGLKVLVAGDQLSEQALQLLCILDSRVPTYNKDWTKFITECQTVTGGRSSNPGVPQNYY